jgi:hypothetical protein
MSVAELYTYVKFIKAYLRWCDEANHFSRQSLRNDMERRGRPYINEVEARERRVLEKMRGSR